LHRSITALVPVYNAESTLPESVSQILDILSDLTHRFELVVIDDGSTDATIEVADELATIYPQLVIVRHAVPRGRVAAIRSGFEQCAGDTIFLTDQRCVLPLEHISRLWEAVDEHELVLGVPIAPNSPGGLRATAIHSGGYWLGHRRAFGGLIAAMANQAALLTELRRLDYQWHQVQLNPRAGNRQKGVWGSRRLSSARGSASIADHAARVDQPAPSRASPRQPSYSTIFPHLQDA